MRVLPALALLVLVVGSLLVLLGRGELVEPSPLERQEPEVDGPVLVGRGTDVPVPPAPVPGDVHLEGELATRTARRVEISGMVLSLEGAPVAQAEVVAGCEGGHARTRTDAQGSFVLRVPAGRYDISFFRRGVGRRVFPRQLVDEVAWRNREVRLAEAGTIWLRFRAGTDPVAGRVVRLCAETPWGAVHGVNVEGEDATDSDGMVRFDDLPTGGAVARVAVRDGWTLHQPVNADQRRSPLVRDLPTGKGGVLHGLVHDGATGRAVAGARVDVWLSAVGSGARFESSTVTGDDGRYAFPPIRGSLLALWVEAAGYAQWPTAVRVLHERRNALPQHHDPARYPMYAHLTEGHDVTFDVDLSEGHAVEGHVRDEQGQGVAGVPLRLVAHTNFGSDRFETRTDERGAFRFERLPSLRSPLQLGAPGWFPDRVSRVQIGTDDPAPAGPLEVVVRRGRKLRGTVTTSDGRPAPGTHVWIDGSDRRIESVRYWGRPMETFSDEDGAWNLDDVPPWDEVTVQAARGEHTSTPYPLADEGLDPPPIALRLGTGATIRGAVADWKGPPQDGGTVRLHPVDPQGEEAPAEQRLHGNRTSFAFQNVRPGRYRLTAWLGAYATDEPVEVDARAGTTVEVVLPLKPEVTLSGQVVDADGRPVPEAVVQLSGSWREDRRRHKVREKARTDRDGHFAFAKVRAGSYAVAVSADGFQATREGRLTGAEPALRIVLEPK